MKFYLAILCIFGMENLLADTMKHQYESDVIIPKALQSTSQTVNYTQQQTLKKVNAKDNQAKTLSSTPATSISKKDKEMLGDNLVYGTLDVNSNNVIIPPSLQSKYKKEVIGVAPKVSPQNRPLIKADEQADSHQAIQVGDKSIPNIEGVYVLAKGSERNVAIKHALLVVERLDADDFGYYYVTQMQSFPATAYYGIFHYKKEKKRFFNKIYETSATTTTRDNVDIKYDNQQLETIISIDVGERAILWNRVLGVKDYKSLEYNPILEEALKEAKASYLEIYKKHPSFLDQ